jgi:hypothetical protein
VYTRRIGGKEYTFGVSGLLYRANVLMYDHQTESLWSQVKREAVTGSMTGTRLEARPSTVTTWSRWKKKHPGTLVLSLETGHDRDYTQDPYEDYYRSRRGFFSGFFKPGPGEEEKEMVAGLNIGGHQKAYPVDHLRRAGTLSDRLGDKEVTFTWDDDLDGLSARTADGKEIQPIIVYWFVWKGIHPESELFRPEK